MSVALLQLIQGEQSTYLPGCKYPSKTNESPHDLDIDLNGTFAPKHTGEHSHALFSEGIGWVPTSSPLT